MSKETEKETKKPVAKKTTEKSVPKKTSEKAEDKKTSEKVSSKLKEITSSRRLKMEKKPIPKNLVENEGIKYFFYFLYVFLLAGFLTSLLNLIDLSYYLNIGTLFSTNNPLVPVDIATVLPLNFYTFFLAILALLLRASVAIGLAVLAFDDDKDSWLRIVAVLGIVFIIFGVQIIGP
ncbi:MAG: hypothetical protein ACXACX_01900 [Candidatus Hodarchaeales archaeon]